ncbi:MAG TPA: DUF6249 domain-containing protein [Candidatus Kapabacteria bacterium]|nr:DUF6249 domain-containing protein [Candidatus Kapabacteria bacterium]
MSEDIIIAPIAILATFGIPAIILWKYFSQRHQERMLIIEKGDPNLYKEMLTTKKWKDPLNALKWGLLVTFVGIGLWLGIWMYQMHWYDEDIEPACMLIGGGIALVIYYIIALKMRKKEPLPDENRQ